MEIKQRGSHLDHLVRQTRMHHTQLSSMADMKANMLLTITSVVITLSISYITDPHLKWAIVALIAFCLMTIGLATYAVMPKIPFSFKTETRETVNPNVANLLPAKTAKLAPERAICALALFCGLRSTNL